MNHVIRPAADGVPTIAVIGGGFSGAAFALHLLRDFPGIAAARVAIIEPRECVGAGLAYSTTEPANRINVAAARMAIFAEDPEHFARWFGASGRLAADPEAAVAGAGLFPRRGDFGRYVHETLQAAAEAAPHAQLRHVRDRATAVTPEGSGFRVALQRGGSIAADVLVLAPGHPPTDPPAPLRRLAGDGRLLADPWADGALASIAPNASVLIVGTGLTMADVLASLRELGHRGSVVAISRRGLLPRPRTKIPVRPGGDFSAAPSRTASALLRRVRAAVAAAAASGRPWEDTIEAVRAQGRAIWGALPPDERRRLLRHVQPFWDVHRYQLAPQIDAVLRAELASGALQVLAGSLRSVVRLPGGRLRVELHPRGAAADAVHAIECDAIVTCTGPVHRSAIARNPALRSLADAGLIRPDAYGLGIEVDDQGRAVDVAGRPGPNLLVVGPPARGAWGELMGLPQVSAQPREVAALLAARLADIASRIDQEAIHERPDPARRRASRDSRGRPAGAAPVGTGARHSQ